MKHAKRLKEIDLALRAQGVSDKERILRKHLIIKLESGNNSDDDRNDAIMDAMEEYKNE